MEEQGLWVSRDREKGFQWSRKDGQEGFVSGNRWGHLWVFDLEILRPGEKSTLWSFGMGEMLGLIQRSRSSKLIGVSSPGLRPGRGRLGGPSKVIIGQGQPPVREVRLKDPSPGKWPGSQRGQPERARGAGLHPAHSDSGSPPSGPCRPRASCASSAGCHGGLGRAP